MKPFSEEASFEVNSICLPNLITSSIPLHTKSMGWINLVSKGFSKLRIRASDFAPADALSMGATAICSRLVLDVGGLSISIRSLSFLYSDINFIAEDRVKVPPCRPPL